MKPTDPFPRLLQAFFYEWLVQQRNASAHTVRSCRDTWRLFLRFVAQRQRRPVAQLRLSDLTAAEVSAFLHHTEQARGDTIGTRNCRLSALRSFFAFVADREPRVLDQCTQILHVPLKKAPIPAPYYLEPEEVKAILAQPDHSTLEGQRDQALLRRATAVHLVAAGVDITVIRSWLGHVSLDTTNHYAQANLETKRQALERLASPSRPAKRPSWKQDPGILAWLDSP